MKIITASFILFLFIFQLSVAQCDAITELSFPYTKGLEMSFKGKNTTYDELNFPVKMVEKFTHYQVSEDSENKGKKNSVFVVNIVLDKDTVVRNHKSPLRIDASGMSWVWEKKKTTQAIDLPLVKGKKWTTYWGEGKQDMTCFTTDSLMSLYFGKVKTFGISYERVKGKDERFVYFEEFREWYNGLIGKVAVSYKTYGIEKTTGREFVFYREEALLSYTNVSEERIQEALKLCQ